VCFPVTIGSVVELIDHAIEEAADQLCYLVKMRAMVGGAEDHAKDHDGWIEHTGTECPVHPTARVDVLFMDGKKAHKMRATACNWRKPGTELDITHYRIHKP
jgi:hypothetical protein